MKKSVKKRKLKKNKHLDKNINILLIILLTLFLFLCITVLIQSFDKKMSSSNGLHSIGVGDLDNKNIDNYKQINSTNYTEYIQNTMESPNGLGSKILLIFQVALIISILAILVILLLIIYKKQTSSNNTSKNKKTPILGIKIKE
jgi:flagellar basal body-associated protein FliL